jgi:hypothetical protein
MKRCYSDIINKEQRYLLWRLVCKSTLIKPYLYRKSVRRQHMSRVRIPHRVEHCLAHFCTYRKYMCADTERCILSSNHDFRFPLIVCDSISRSNFLARMQSFENIKVEDLNDRLCVLLVRVSGYRCWGPGFDSRRYQIFWEVVGLERGPLRLVRIIEELLEWKSSGSGLGNRKLTAVGIRFADHATPSIR